MESINWLKQTDKPLFAQLEWDKPERRDQAGRLLIVGGHQHNLNAPGKAYEYVQAAGIGSVQIVLPSKVKSLVGATLPGSVFLPSTPSGELSRDGLGELVVHAQWADTILLAGDVGRNSQTTLLLTDLMEQVSTPIVITKDALDACQNTPEVIVNRPDTTVVASFSQLQLLVKRLNWPEAFTFGMGLVKLVEQLQKFTASRPVNIVTLHENIFVVASGGQVSSTPYVQTDETQRAWRTRFSATASCYLTWHQERQFEALTHSAFLVK